VANMNGKRLRYLVHAGRGGGRPAYSDREAESAGNPPNRFICRVGKIGMVPYRLSVVNW
jgi:hypothetical protein